MKKTMVIEIDYYELEKLIKATYGQEYEIPCTEEADHCSLTKVIDAEPLEQWNVKDLEEFKQGKPKCFLLQTLMRDMCINGVLEPGKYSIEIDW